MSLLSATSFLPVFIIIIIAFISARLMVRDTAVLKSHAFVNIDGLRGVLAILVFIHQSVYWFNYSHSQQWSFYGSATYLSFGQASSCLFFMLSGFLFGHQLLESRNKEKEIDWLGFFYARIIRLAPLYLVCIFAMLVIVAFEAGFIQFEDTAILRSNIIDWLVFAIPGHPNINTNGNITLAFSGTIWILAYQWFFYLCLPLIALLVGSKSRSHSGIWLIISCLCVASFSRWGLDASLFYGFAGGGFAAYAVRTPWLHEIFQGKGANWVVLAGLLLAYSVFDNNHYFTRLVILTLCMTFIACGANLFGVLSCRGARALGVVSYGIFLLHGLVLYVMLMHLVGPNLASKLTEPQYWLIIIFCTPVVIGLSSLSWHWIEWPAILSSAKISQFLRSKY